MGVYSQGPATMARNAVGFFPSHSWHLAELRGRVHTIPSNHCIPNWRGPIHAKLPLSRWATEVENGGDIGVQELAAEASHLQHHRKEWGGSGNPKEGLPCERWNQKKNNYLAQKAKLNGVAQKSKASGGITNTSHEIDDRVREWGQMCALTSR